MKNAKIFSSALILLVLPVFFTSPLEATPINLDFIYWGDTPSGTSPWLVADVSDRTAGGVLLELDVRNLAGSQFVGSWFLNLYNLDSGVVVLPSFETGYIPTASFAYSFSPTGGLGLGSSPLRGFELGFEFSRQASDHGNRLAAGETLRVILSGVTAASFFPPPGETGYISAAHIQGIPLATGPEGSAWVAARIAPPGPQPVAEPETILLLGLGLTATAGVLRRRTR